MGDEIKQYKIQIKGSAYTFDAIPEIELGKIQMIFNMNASLTRTIKAVTRVLKASAGDEQWDALTDRLIEDEITLEDAILRPLKELLKRQAKDRQAESGNE